MTSPHQTIYCDCCGQEGLAYVKDDKITIVKESHGRRHVFVLTPEIFNELIGRLTEPTTSVHNNNGNHSM